MFAGLVMWITFFFHSSLLVVVMSERFPDFPPFQQMNVLEVC